MVWIQFGLRLLSIVLVHSVTWAIERRMNKTDQNDQCNQRINERTNQKTDHRANRMKRKRRIKKVLLQKGLNLVFVWMLNRYTKKRTK